jgi:hypothetical protein
MGDSKIPTTRRIVDVDDKREPITAVFGALGPQAGAKARKAGRRRLVRR